MIIEIIIGMIVEMIIPMIVEVIVMESDRCMFHFLPGGN